MGIGDSLGKLAKDWARSKATELFTADSDKRADAGARSDAAEDSARDQVGEAAVRAAFPELAAYADQQEERQRSEDQQRNQAEQDRIAALPRAHVKAGFTGAVEWHFDGDLPVLWEERPPRGPEASEWELADPYATAPTLVVDLTPSAGARPPVADRSLLRWRIFVPGYAGDGTYDLVAVARARMDAGYDTTYEEWAIELDETGDYCFSFFHDAGPASVTVADGGHRLTVSMHYAGAMGQVHATGEVTRP